MDIILAKTAGFCFGVSRAFNMAEDTVKEHPNCFTLGSIVHNESVVKRLEENGVHKKDKIEELPENSTVIIRSHGAAEAEYRMLRERGMNIVDATCPAVARIHEIVRQASEEGRTLVVIGTPNHPEVQAICGWCRDPHVFETAEEFGVWLKTLPDKNIPVTVVYQTTGLRKNMEKCNDLIKKECTNAKVFDTICNTTSNRQSEAASLSAECDVMVVIGGKDSANSRRLYEICRENCKRSYFIENAEEIRAMQLYPNDKVGITAGASTPAWIIKEVYNNMCDENKAMEVTPVETEEKAEMEESFEELLEKSIKTLNTGEKVIGIVTSIAPTEISVDLGTKQSGYIPITELTDDPDLKPEDIVQVGKEIETYVMRVNDVEGTVMLSKKRLDTVKNWDDIEAARENRTPVEGTVVEENKGGVVVSVKGIRVFVPASQTGLAKDAPMSELLKQKVKLRITEVNHSRRRVVGSIRAVAYEERRMRSEQIWNEIEEGKKYTGTVKSITSYGVFVDIGGIDGMVHISELSWDRIRHPSEVVSVGDTIEVYVISFDKENKKISLGHKDHNENPWVKFNNAYSVGDVAKVTVVKLMPFGVFARVMPGVDGLIHISQIADHRIGKPEDVLSEGQEVEAKIIEIDDEKQKISLSIRALIEEAKAAEAAEAQKEESAPIEVF